MFFDRILFAYDSAMPSHSLRLFERKTRSSFAVASLQMHFSFSYPLTFKWKFIMIVWILVTNRCIFFRISPKRFSIFYKTKFAPFFSFSFILKTHRKFLLFVFVPLYVSQQSFSWMECIKYQFNGNDTNEVIFCSSVEHDRNEIIKTIIITFARQKRFIFNGTWTRKAIKN